MDVLGGLLGGQRRQEYDDFIQRYEQGAPWDGISDEEAVDRYRQVAPQLPAAEYEQSARDAFARLSPEQRVEFGRWLQSRTRQGGVSVPDLDRDGIDDRFQDPSDLARMTTRVREQQPGFLDGILGGALGGAGGGLGAGFGDAVLGGLSGGPGGQTGAGGGLLGSPIAKAAMAGIAAMAARRFLSGR